MINLTTVMNKIEADLNWRGPSSGIRMNNVVLPRDYAERLKTAVEHWQADNILLAKRLAEREADIERLHTVNAALVAALKPYLRGYHGIAEYRAAVAAIKQAEGK